MLRRRRTRLAVLALLVAVAAVGGYLALGFLIYDRVAATSASCGGATATPADVVVAGVDAEPYRVAAFEDVRLPGGDPGIELAAWWLPPPIPDGPVVVLVHGHSSCRREGGILLMAGMLHRAGIGSLLVDLRDHGDSTIEDGRFAGGSDEHRDVLAAWRWLRERGVPAERIGLAGISLGAATVLIATGEEPAVAAVWADSSYGDLLQAVGAQLEHTRYPAVLAGAAPLVAWLVACDDLSTYQPLRAVARLDGRPIALVHGDADERLSVDFVRQLAAAVRADGGSVEPWIVPGAGHAEAITRETATYERRLVAFFREALGG